MTAKQAPETIHHPTEVLQEQGTWLQSHRALRQETSHRFPIQEKQTPFLQAERESRFEQYPEAGQSSLWVPEAPEPKPPPATPSEAKSLRDRRKPRIQGWHHRELALHRTQAGCQAEHEHTGLFSCQGWPLPLTDSEDRQEVPSLVPISMVTLPKGSPCGLCHPLHTQRCCSCGRSPFPGVAATGIGPGLGVR